MSNHSVLRVILTPQISNLMETLIFSLRWDVAYAQFCPIPSLFLLILSKNDFEVKEVLENRQKPRNYLYERNVNMGGRLDKTEHRE